MEQAIDNPRRSLLKTLAQLDTGAVCRGALSSCRMRSAEGGRTTAAERPRSPDRCADQVQVPGRTASRLELCRSDSRGVSYWKRSTSGRWNPSWCRASILSARSSTVTAGLAVSTFNGPGLRDGSRDVRVPSNETTPIKREMGAHGRMTPADIAEHEVSLPSSAGDGNQLDCREKAFIVRGWNVHGARGEVNAR